ncbi:MAG TPA: GNAT family N-acetyltransferase [Bryobacteraceae bacterium]|jgi:ribosomal protein S18 acetylase RimI-like enzyme|nr:GNAT family N-acetyltransferase [Bryobacteraceae bacterium]
MEIRFLNTDDAGEWLRLRLEALKHDPEAFSASLEEYESLSVEEVKRRLWSSADAFVVGATEDGRLIGMAGFYREQGLKTRHKGRVWGVYVSPAMRGKGIGRGMMQKLLERGKKVIGVEQILISVTSTQAAAVSLYRSLGFELFGREPHALKVGGRFIDEEYMAMTPGTDAQK